MRFVMFQPGRLLAWAGFSFLFLFLASKGLSWLEFKVETTAEKVSISGPGFARLEGTALEVFALPLDSATALMGSSIKQDGRLVFTPALPLLLGRSYKATVHYGGGLKISRDFHLPASPAAAAPTVSLLPRAPLPANALKLFLQFSQPMEQGVFLDKLKLMDASGYEIIGPFRETELWSADGKRLTVWFHPGRQKSGVNLNEEEGPVLLAGSSCTLHVAGDWRSSTGIALGAEMMFSIDVGHADHVCPDPTQWRIKVPDAHTQDALCMFFNEALDISLLQDAINVRQLGTNEDLALKKVVDESGYEWRASLDFPWIPGDYEIHINPLLEDLAGNNLLRPFEVNMLEKQSASKVLPVKFSVR